MYDSWARYAEIEAALTYGARVDIETKGKSLFKFGRTTNADSGQVVTIMDLPGATQYEETLSTTNDIDAISSSDDGDTETVTIEGHTIDGSGNLTFVTPQTVTLTGQTPVSLGTPLARATRMYNANGTSGSPAANLVGNIYAFASSGVTVTAGVPQTNTAVKAMISAGQQQTRKCATAISNADYWFITGLTTSALRATGSGARVDVELQVKEKYGVWRPRVADLYLATATQPTITIKFEPWIIVPPNSDVRMVAISDTADTTVTATMAGVLASVLG